MKVAILRLLFNWLSRCQCKKPHIKIRWTISMGQWLSYIFYSFVKMELLVQNFRKTVTISYPYHTKIKEISYDILLHWKTQRQKASRKCCCNSTNTVSGFFFLLLVLSYMYISLVIVHSSWSVQSFSSLRPSVQIEMTDVIRVIGQVAFDGLAGKQTVSDQSALFNFVGW
jgi:hypothetical protein